MSESSQPSAKAPAAEVQGRIQWLEAEVTSLRRRLNWRTAALEILLIGVASITAVIWITKWWPWR